MAGHGMHMAALALGGAAGVQSSGGEPALHVHRGAVLVTKQCDAGMAERERRIVGDRLREAEERSVLHSQQRADASVVGLRSCWRRGQRHAVEVAHQAHPQAPSSSNHTMSSVLLYLTLTLDPYHSRVAARACHGGA